MLNNTNDEGFGKDNREEDPPRITICISCLDLYLEVLFPVSVPLHLPPLFLPSFLSNSHLAVVVNIHDLVPPLTADVVNTGSLYPCSNLFDIFVIGITGG